MPVHHGRHEMPGWRGYLPESVDRSARRGIGRRGATPGQPTSRRLVAAGALAACALAGGAVSHTRSSGPPDAPSGPADDAASALARSSAWTGEATPVLAAIETELRRTDEVRGRWDASARVRREGSPPGAVVALLERRTELTHHRDALRSAIAAVSSARATESVLASAWPQLRAAQEMLRALVAGRGELGDPLETKVLSLLVRESSRTSGGPPASGGDVGRGTRGGVEDAVTVALAAPTAEPADPAAASIPGPAEVAEPLDVARGSVATVESATEPVYEASGEVVRSAGAGPAETDESPEPDTSRAAATDLSEAGTDGDPDRPTDQVLGPSSDRTMLTFDRPSSGAADSEPPGAEETAVSDVPPTDSTGEEASACQDRLTERSDRRAPTAPEPSPS